MSKAVILTGLRANNDLHIGNYFAALKPLIKTAKEKAGDYQVNLFVPDLHSFTTPIDHSQLYNQTIENVRLFVAAGLPIEHADVYIYRQSYIPAHSELTWILDCFSGVGEMNRMTQFKDKSQKQSADRLSMGLLNYPILMAADMLLYDAEYIPVGEDQRQHIEFTRDLAERFNSRFGSIFKPPKDFNKQLQFFNFDQGLRIRNLLEPAVKMSKSDVSAKGVIYLSDRPEEAAQKIRSATTDSLGKVAFDFDGQPGISNLLQLLALLSDRSIEEVQSEWQQQTSYGPLKEALGEKLGTFLGDFQKNLASVNRQQIMDKLITSEKAMNEQANSKLLRVQQAVGLRS